MPRTGQKLVVLWMGVGWVGVYWWPGEWHDQMESIQLKLKLKLKLSLTKIGGAGCP